MFAQFNTSTTCQNNSFKGLRQTYPGNNEALLPQGLCDDTFKTRTPTKFQGLLCNQSSRVLTVHTVHREHPNPTSYRPSSNETLMRSITCPQRALLSHTNTDTILTRADEREGTFGEARSFIPTTHDMRQSNTCRVVLYLKKTIIHHTHFTRAHTHTHTHHHP